MTDDALDQVLRLVAEGRLTADEAGPILDALETRAAADADPARSTPGGSKASSDDVPARAIRIEVSDAGRNIVNLRVPLALGRAALDNIPGFRRRRPTASAPPWPPASRARSSRSTTTATASESRSNDGRRGGDDVTCYDPAPARSAGDLPTSSPPSARRHSREPTGRVRPTWPPDRRRRATAEPARPSRSRRRRPPARASAAIDPAPPAARRPDRRVADRPSTAAPPLTTVRGRRRTSMSMSGSASTATRSANRPGASDPTRSSQPIIVGAVSVADRIASTGV